MKAVKLTQRDINEMIRRTVHSVLNEGGYAPIMESMGEERGSIMAGREDIIQSIMNDIKEKWEEIKKNHAQPVDSGEVEYNDRERHISFKCRQDIYVLMAGTNEKANNLNVAKDFVFNVGVFDYVMPKDKEKLFDISQRAANGTTYGGGNYNKFSRNDDMVKHGRIDIEAVSVNGELQTRQLYSTIYHELNHIASHLEVQKKHKYLDDGQIDKINLISATRRKIPAHYIIARGLHPDPATELIGNLFGDPVLPEAKKRMTYVFYSVWETTERNARAEALYGELKELNPKREDFKTVWPETELHRQLTELKGMVDYLKNVPASLRQLWDFAATAMNMQRRGKNNKSTHGATERFYAAVKERFIERSEAYLEEMFRKGMKVATLFFDRKEERERKKKEESNGTE